LWDINTAPHAGYTEAMAHEIKKALEKLILNGKKLVIVYPVPEMGWSVPDFIATRSLHGTLEKNSGAVSYESFLNRNRSAYAALDSIGDESNVLRVYPASILCNSYVKGSCAAHVKGTPLYLDDDHLSDYGANLIAQEILSKMSYFNE